MGKVFSKKAVVAMVLLLALSVLSIFLFMDKGVPSRVADTEFQNGSGIQFTTATDLQLENLHRLAKVWGFVKYRHPDITGGKLNWDAELFRVMPDVLDADSAEGANQAVLDWLNKFPFAVPEMDVEIVEVSAFINENKILEADLSWVKDGIALGDGLSAYLTKLSERMVLDSTNGYVSFAEGSLAVSIANEIKYSNMKYDDTGMRLLGLFRYWNIIEYFYPYKDIIDDDWDNVLSEMLPKFMVGQDEQSYVLSIAELSTHIHDSHSGVVEKSHVLANHFGRKVPPVEFMTIDGQIVISAIADNVENVTTSLQLGDIVLSMDDVSIKERIDECKKYHSLSNENRFARIFRYRLLGTDKDTATIEVLRDGKPLSLAVSCYEEIYPLSDQELSGFMKNEQIGYINPATLKEGELDRLMSEFQNTDGIIVDLRRYPSAAVGRIALDLAEYLIPSPVPFVKYGCSVPLVPGTFTMTMPVSSGSGSFGKTSDKPIYTGKVVLLMDETSVSSSEFTVMSLRNAPNAVVLGSPSMGADGNRVDFMLPGAVTASMTGLSVFYPDGRQTQRVGLEPDIYCLPTIEDIKAGRDTLLDKAVELILKTA